MKLLKNDKYQVNNDLHVYYYLHSNIHRKILENILIV